MMNSKGIEIDSIADNRIGLSVLGLERLWLPKWPWSIIRVVKRSERFDAYFVSLVGAWVAYQTQSFISINQIGLAIWGWILSGLIIGYEINTRVKDTAQSIPTRGKQQIKTLIRCIQMYVIPLLNV